MLTASSYANWIYFLFSPVSNDSVDWWAAQWKSCSPLGLVLLLFALVHLNQKAVTHWGRPQIPSPFSVYYLAANISQLREDTDAGLEEWEGRCEGTATPAYSQLLPSAAHLDPVLRCLLHAKVAHRALWSSILGRRATTDLIIRRTGGQRLPVLQTSSSASADAFLSW